MSKQAKELRKLGKEDRAKRLAEARLELMKDRAQVATGTAPKNASKIRTNRKTIARILTFNE